jgi:hypothetical protein
MRPVMESDPCSWVLVPGYAIAFTVRTFHRNQDPESRTQPWHIFQPVVYFQTALFRYPHILIGSFGLTFQPEDGIAFR